MNNIRKINQRDFKALNELHSTEGIEMSVNIIHSFFLKIITSNTVFKVFMKTVAFPNFHF